jgi:hypothetical protein
MILTENRDAFVGDRGRTSVGPHMRTTTYIPVLSTGTIAALPREVTTESFESELSLPLHQPAFGWGMPFLVTRATGHVSVA